MIDTRCREHVPPPRRIRLSCRVVFIFRHVIEGKTTEDGRLLEDDNDEVRCNAIAYELHGRDTTSNNVGWFLSFFCWSRRKFGPRARVSVRFWWLPSLAHW